MSKIDMVNFIIREMQRNEVPTIYLNPVLFEQCKEAGMNLGPHFQPAQKLELTPTPQATTEGVAEVLRKLWKEQP